MSQRSDLDYLCDHIDQHFGVGPWGNAPRARQWSKYLAATKGVCIGYSARTLPGSRAHPNGQTRGDLLQLTIFGETQTGSDCELLEWAIWQGEQHKDEINVAELAKAREKYQATKKRADAHEQVKP